MLLIQLTQQMTGGVIYGFTGSVPPLWCQGDGSLGTINPASLFYSVYIP